MDADSNCTDAIVTPVTGSQQCKLPPSHNCVSTNNQTRWNHLWVCVCVCVCVTHPRQPWPIKRLPSWRHPTPKPTLSHTWTDRSIYLLNDAGTPAMKWCDVAGWRNRCGRGWAASSSPSSSWAWPPSSSSGLHLLSPATNPCTAHSGECLTPSPNYTPYPPLALPRPSLGLPQRHPGPHPNRQPRVPVPRTH